MPLFNESLESIAQAIVTVKRALKARAIEKKYYKELEDYLNQRAKNFKLKKSHIAKANRDLDDELQAEVEEFFMDEDDALYKMAEEILEEFRDEAVDCDKQAVYKTWAMMNNEERAEMAVLASKWQKSR
jgi:hypothetical protein